MKDAKIQNLGGFGAENTVSPCRAHEIEDWKMSEYRDCWRKMKAREGDPYALAYALPCPSPFCRETVVAVTFDELDSIRKGECVCGICRHNSGKSKRLREWERICPEAFRRGSTATIPEKLERLSSLAIFWAGEIPRTSLYICGETGTQKSRTVFHLLGEKTLPGAARYRVLGGGEFRELILSASGNFGAVNDVKQDLAETDLLVFDDFAQDALTDTMIADLWSVLDKRFRAGKTTVFLSNLTAGEILQRYGENTTVKSLVRRIKDFCKFMRF